MLDLLEGDLTDWTVEVEHDDDPLCENHPQGDPDCEGMLCGVTTPPAPPAPVERKPLAWFEEAADLGYVEGYNMALAEARAAVNYEDIGTTSGGHSRFAYRTAAALMLGDGLTFQATASELGVDVGIVVRSFFTDQVTVPQVLEAERLLRDGAESYGAVASQAGCSKDAVRHLAKVCRLQSEVERRRAQGGTDGHDAATVQRILELRAEGLGYGSIAAQVGMTKSQVSGLLRRLAARAVA